MKKLLLLFLLSAMPAGVFAQEEPAVVRVRRPFTPQHELRLTAGAYPLMPYTDGRSFDASFPFISSRTHLGPVYTSGVWSLSYDYRFRRWFDLGLTLGYYGEYSNSYSNRDSSLVGRNRAHAVTVMPMARFTWLNRRWVRMYSSLGLGATFGYGRFDTEGSRPENAMIAFQVTPVGISVGRSFFGFAEIGLGAQGALMMGVGYRFNPKNKRAK
ncbi:MAG TPA: hypothetical protein DEH06_04365 [Alistipes sp.]|jgi:hypothetical protein|nr:hypothetical protein [Alistipes sp.]